MTKQRTALLSVYDKEGIVEFARALVSMGWNIISSGGTHLKLTGAGVPSTDVADLVGGEAILGHRVVTLSREVHAGLLARYTKDDLSEMEALGLPYIDLVCFNLYPLAKEVARSEATHESVIEKTDIGGPTALNSAAKGERIVIGDPDDYGAVLEWLEVGEPDREQFLRKLEAKAYFVTSKYYLPAARFHSDGRYDGVHGELAEALKYGENPYMTPAGLYKTDDDPLAVHRFELVEGDERVLPGWEVCRVEVDMQVAGCWRRDDAGVHDAGVRREIRTGQPDNRQLIGARRIIQSQVDPAVGTARVDRKTLKHGHVGCGPCGRGDSRERG